MTFNEYQAAALGTASGMADGHGATARNLITNGVMGMCGESGECIDIVKKHTFQGHPLDKDALAEELGDVLWYVAICAAGLGTDLADIAERNIAKLAARYPNGFEAERSIHREDA